MVAKTYIEQHARIKKNVEEGRNYFDLNNARFYEFRKLVFETSITPADIEVLEDTQKPQVEFNILEAFVSRLRGEFAKQEPSLSVRAKDASQVDPQMIDCVEAHLRSLFFDAANDMLEYDIYTDILTGGFSVMKVYTDFCNEMSFDQDIYVRRAFDPTLCGFDPLARKSHKGDGRYCFEVYPKTREEFEEKYGKEATKKMNFISSFDGYTWSFRTEKRDMVLVCDYYEKKEKRVKIYRLSDGQVMTMENYNKFIEDWNNKGIIQQAPIIVGKPRTTTIKTICHYKLTETDILEYEETDYAYLPLIFVDGNSVMLRNGTTGSAHQMTKPYVYHAKGVQKLKNFAGQCLANELENMVQHKWMVSKESIPPEYIKAYKDNQHASLIVYNAYKDNDPNVPLPPPQAIQRTPAPPEVMNTFRLTDEMTQMILGSYDTSLGINDNQLSGVAIVEGATQSNATAMPYIVGFLKGLNQAANIIVDLIPKYYKTPRTIPVMRSDGKRSYIKINQPQGMQFNYDPNVLEVKVEAGVNFEVQKDRARQMILQLMQASPLFAQFINTSGLTFLLDNIDMRGIDQLKEAAEGYQQQMQQMQQQQMQAQQNQPNPIQMKAQLEQQKLQLQAQDLQSKHMISQSQLQIDAAKLKNDQMKILADLKTAQNEGEVEKLKSQAEIFSKQVDLALKGKDMAHNHAMDIHNFHREKEVSDAKEKQTNV
jgi:hypothetical protein